MPSSSTAALTFADVERALPAGVRLEERLGEATLRMRLKLVGPGVALLLAAAVWAAYVGVGMEAGVVGAVATALPLVYLALGFVLGSRRVILDEAGVRSRTVPLPLPGDGSLARDSIAGLDVVTVGARSGSLSWRIDARTERGDKTLVTDLASEAQARVVADYLAACLRIRR